MHCINCGTLNGFGRGEASRFCTTCGADRSAAILPNRRYIVVAHELVFDVVDRLFGTTVNTANNKRRADYLAELANSGK